MPNSKSSKKRKAYMREYAGRNKVEYPAKWEGVYLQWKGRQIK